MPEPVPISAPSRPQAQRQRLRGMSQDRLALGASQICRTCDMWAVAIPRRSSTPPSTSITQASIVEGYDPPEGWGWCYVDE